MEPVNNDGMCRCCASEGTFKDLQSTYLWMGIGEVYSDMIKDCFDISLSTSISGNGGICEVCITQLRNACNFKKQVEQTEEQFRRRLADSEFRADVVKIEVPPDVEGHDADNDPFEGTVSGEFSRPANVLKIEVPPDDEDHDADNDPFEGTMSDEFSGPEYDIPLKNIKIEKEIEKPKKRAAKPSTSKAKKPKAEDGEPSVKRESCKATKKNKKCKREKSKRQPPEPKAKQGEELEKHRTNIREIIQWSNATPIRCRGGIGYACCFCTNQYPDPADLKRHTIEVHDDETKLNFMRGRDMYGYFVKLDITSLKCIICGLNLDTLENVMDHLKIEHEKNISTNINNHIMPFKFDSETLKCFMCQNVFNKFKALQEHMNTHYRNYICNDCDAGFVNRHLLLCHREGHKTGTFTCERCTKVFNTLRKKKLHERIVHNGLNMPHKCGYCNERFKENCHKNEHLAKVHGVVGPVIKCQACDKTFTTQQTWLLHTKKYHLMQRQHKCSRCEMDFFSKRELTDHMVKHTGTREYRCDICFKSYGRLKTLKEHMRRLHSEERGFKCVRCGQSFAQGYTLKSHIAAKH